LTVKLFLAEKKVSQNNSDIHAVTDEDNIDPALKGV